jgi:hypothetical protein
MRDAVGVVRLRRGLAFRLARLRRGAAAKATAFTTAAAANFVLACTTKSPSQDEVDEEAAPEWPAMNAACAPSSSSCVSVQCNVESRVAFCREREGVDHLCTTESLCP